MTKEYTKIAERWLKKLYNIGHENNLGIEKVREFAEFLDRRKKRSSIGDK